MSRRMRRQGIDLPLDVDVSRELDFHLEEARRELIEEGWETAEAEQEARRRFGNFDDIARECRHITRRQRQRKERRAYLDELRQDLAYGLRGLARRPGFTAVALLTLALGIGATTVFFSLIDGIVLEPLAYPDPQRLVALRELSEQGTPIAVSWPNFVDWRNRSRSFRGVAAHSTVPNRVRVTTPSGPTHAGFTSVTRDFFPALAEPPALGRWPGEADHRLGAAPTAVVSHRFWSNELGGENDLDALTVEILGSSAQVVGVMPPGFDHPRGTDAWVPREIAADRSSRTGHNWSVLARLEDGVTLDAARAEMSTLAATLQQEYSGDNDAFDVRVEPLKAEVVGTSATPLGILFACSALVLLITCINLASNLLAQAMGRQREISIRAALGAGRARMLRQLLTESVLLTSLGGLLGAVLSLVALPVLRGFLPVELPRLDRVAIDGRVLAFTALVSVATGLVFGIVPALHAVRRSLGRAVSEGTPGLSSVGHQRSWRMLVTAQVALALVLLMTAGLMLRSLLATLDVDPGFVPDNLLTVSLTAPRPPGQAEPTIADLLAVEDEAGRWLASLLAEVRGVPGIESAGIVSHLPLTGVNPSGTFYVDGRGEDDPGYAAYRVVSEGYFDSMGIPMLRGRDFSAADGPDSPHVAIVDAALAERYWPDEEPIGQRILYVGMDLHEETWLQVVGVTGSVHHGSLAQEPPPTVYVPARQRAFKASVPTLVARLGDEPASVAPMLRARLREADPTQAISVERMADHLAESTRQQRFLLAVVASFAGLALLLASLGLYGVASYASNQRRREVGIRMALGADRASVVSQLLRSSVLDVAAGLTLGVVLILALRRVLASQLHAVEPHDPAAFLAAVAILGGAGLLASWLPVWRSTTISPTRVLRED